MTTAGDSAKNQRSAEIQTQIQTWLMEEGWRIRSEDVSDAEWFLSGESEARVRIGIGQKKGRQDQIIIQGSVLFQETQQEQINRLPTDKRSDFLWDIRFRLLDIGVEFSGIAEPLREIRVSQRIYHDGLTKDRFLQRVSQVRNGVLTVIWMIARKLAQPPPEHTVGFKPPKGD